MSFYRVSPSHHILTIDSQRLKEMKQMSRDPQAAAKARKAERRAEEKNGGVISIKPVSIPSSGTKPTATGFKKGGFKNAFGSVDDEEEKSEKSEKKEPRREPKVEGWETSEQVEGESDEEWGDYDPSRPTACWEGCPGRI